MPLPQKHTYTSDDYWNLPEGERAELIDGQLYSMAPPSFYHQKLTGEFYRKIKNFIEASSGTCEVVPAPFAVNLDAESKNWVEPDVFVVCDKSKIKDYRCIGAPDLVIEVVSPSSRKMDYSTKNALYANAGVREYWIVDPEKERTMVFYFEDDAAPAIYSFDQPVPVGIFEQLTITVKDLLK